MFIKPVAGRRVLLPGGAELLPEAGREVEPEQYWLRRLDDGDVIESTPPVDSPVRAAKAE